MRGTVVNTPGYYYAISYWLSALVMILVHGCGKKDVWKYVHGVLSFISIFTVMFFTDGAKILSGGIFSTYINFKRRGNLFS